MKTESKTVIYVDHGYQPHLALVAYSRPEAEFGPAEGIQPDRLTLGYFMAKAEGLLMAGNIHAAFKAEFDVKHGSDSFHDRQEVIPGAKFSNGQLNGSGEVQLEKPGGFYLELGEEVPTERIEKPAEEIEPADLPAAEELDAVAVEQPASSATIAEAPASAPESVPVEPETAPTAEASPDAAVDAEVQLEKPVTIQ